MNLLFREGGSRKVCRLKAGLKNSSLITSPKFKRLPVLSLRFFVIEEVKSGEETKMGQAKADCVGKRET